MAVAEARSSLRCQLDLAKQLGHSIHLAVLEIRDAKQARDDKVRHLLRTIVRQQAAHDEGARLDP